MKIIFTTISILVLVLSYKGQENYRDFEGINRAVLAEWNGVMDSTVANTFSNSVNTSSMCGKYIRSTDLYDNFKFFPLNYLTDVAPYADSALSAPSITMKVRTSAPVGTIVKIQLGTRSFTTFPQGVHSEYTATTTVTNDWELLTFRYYMKPVGGYTTTTDIDKIVVFVTPNSSVTSTTYFDDLMGPNILVLGVHENNGNAATQLFQNSPNPASGVTQINYQLNSMQHVSIELTDVLGRKVSSIVNARMNKGFHAVPFDTRELPNGIYYYTLKMEGYIQTRRMIISR